MKHDDPSGCCCCRLLYGGLFLRVGNYKTMPGDPIEFPSFPDDYPDPYRYPIDGGISVSSLAVGSPWVVDHYNSLLFMSGRASPSDPKAVVRISSKIPEDSADIVRADVPNISPTGTDMLRGVGCAPRKQRVFALVSSATSTNWTINSTDYDGSNFASWLVDGSPSNVGGLQWCHANEKLYYTRVKAGEDDGKNAIYRCDIDGSNPEYVWHSGPNYGSPVWTVSFQNAAYTFDNVNEKL